MSSPHFTDTVHAAWRVLGLIALLCLGGCASTGLLPEPGNEDAASGMAQDAAAVKVPAKVQALFEQATAIMASGDFAEAEFRFKAFLQQYPTYPGAYVNLAIIYANNDDEAAANDALGAALDIDPGFAPALNQHGLALRRSGKFMEAEAAYMKAVTASPEYALAHYNLGVLNELYLQRLDVALENFERYQELVGDDKQVEKWIADLKRRLATDQPAASVADGRT